MAHQFNYELDDRQIKLTMLSASLNYDEAAWDKFQALPITENKLNITNSLPKMEIGISRSVIVPVLFIILIGGLSALLFNVVDFKKKDPVTTEIPLVIPEIAKTDVTKKIGIKENVIIPETQSPTQAIAVVTKSVVTTKTPTVSLAVLTPTITVEKKKIAVIEPKQKDTTTSAEIKKEKRKIKVKIQCDLAIKINFSHNGHTVEIIKPLYKVSTI